MTMIRTYHDLLGFETFEDRLEYLKLGGGVGRSTFGFDRYLNQQFYHSWDWKRVKNHVILRDAGCDLGIPGYEIHTELLVHHMNPINVGDIVHENLDRLLDPNFLITTCLRTHNAIHYGSGNVYPKVVAERTPNDTILWTRR